MSSTLDYPTATQALADYRQGQRENPDREPGAEQRAGAHQAQAFLDDHLSRTRPDVISVHDDHGRVLWHRPVAHPRWTATLALVGSWTLLAFLIGVSLHPVQILATWMLLAACGGYGIQVLAQTARHVQDWGEYRGARRHRAL